MESCTRLVHRVTTSSAVLILLFAATATNGFRSTARAQGAPPADNGAAKDQATAPDAASSASQAPPAVKLGLHVNGPGAFQGYTLMSPNDSTKAYLLDMEGRVVRTWECGCRAGHSAYLLENGNLLRAGTLERGEHQLAGGPGAGGRIQEYSWEGELLWDYKLANETQLQHHDICKLPSGNVLIVAWEIKTRDEALAAGRAPETLSDGPLQPDCLIEVKPTGKTTGDVVWEWHLWDHLIQDRDQSKANYGNVAEHPELVDLNFGEGLDRLLNNPQAVSQLAAIGYVGGPAPGGRGRVSGDWTHINAVAYNAEFDQIMVSSRTFSEIWIIDHGTTTEEAKGHTGGRYGKGGDLLYRWGNPLAYRAGTDKDQTFFNQHNANWIPRGAPGEGHVIVFNNNHRSEEGDYSSVDEIVLPMNAKGEFQRPTGEAFGPKEAVWSYTAPKKTDLSSGFISGATRLPNGNTLICSGANGTLVEVTADKEVVWKYINPTKGGPGRGGPGGFGGFGPPQLGQMLPPFMQDTLQLTDEQKKQVDEIQKEALAKLDKVFNDEQRKQFADMREGRGGPFAFGFGGGGGGRRGRDGGGQPNFGPPGGGQPNFGPPGGGQANAGGPQDGGPRGRGRGGPFGGPPGGGAVFRVYRYAPDYAGLAGKDLTPGKTLVDIVAEEEMERNKSSENELREGQGGVDRR